MNCTVAVAQIDAAVGNLKANAARHADAVRKAIAARADIVVFPELSLTGYTVRDLNWDVALRAQKQELFDELINLSSQITIVFGAVEEAPNFGIYNSAFVIEEGIIASAHRKVYPPTYGMFEEMRYFSRGSDVRCFESRHGRLGILICEDLWHMSLPYVLAQDGAEVIIGIAASPTRLSGQSAMLPGLALNYEHHKTYARLLSSYIVYCNRVGMEDGVSFWGGSHVVGPAGDILAQAQLFEEDLITARIEANEVRRARRLSRHFIDDDMHLTVQQLERIQRERDAQR
ncbi:MAG: nitrilase-related carbon-nitrogen hydrolase [Acidobacteriota bacterium]